MGRRNTAATSCSTTQLKYKGINNLYLIVCSPRYNVYNSQIQVYVPLVPFEADSYIIDVEANTFVKISMSESFSDPSQDQ